MPVSVQIFDQSRTVYVRYFGTLDFSDAIDAVQDFFEQGHHRRVDKHLIDMRDLTHLNETALPHMLLHDSKLSGLVRVNTPLRMAYLMRSKDAPGAKIAEMAAEACNNTNLVTAGLFFHQAEALSFLDLTARDLENPAVT